MIVVKNGAVLTSGFVRVKDQALIPALNVQIRTDSDNPVILDDVETTKLVSALTNTRFNAKYILEITDPSVVTLPTMEDLALEFFGGGIEVKDTQGNEVVLVPILSVPARPNERVPDELDGILIVLTSGLFEVAGFIAEKWVVDTTKNTLPNEINQIIARLFNLETRATAQEQATALLDSEVIKKSGTDFNPSYAPQNAKSPMTKELHDSDIQATENSLGGVGRTLTIKALEDKAENQEIRIADLEATTIEKVFKTSWKIIDANLEPSTIPQPGDNTATFDLPTTDDNNTPIIRAKGDKATYSVSAVVQGSSDPIDATFPIFYESPRKEAVKALRESSGSNLEILFAEVKNDQLIVSRTSGNDIDFSTLRLQNINENIFVAKTEIATKDELQKLSTDLAQELIQKQDSVDTSIVKGTYEGSGITKAVIGKINEHTTFLNLLEASRFDIVKNLDTDKERGVESNDKTSSSSLKVSDDALPTDGALLQLKAPNNKIVELLNEKGKGGVLRETNELTGTITEVLLDELIKAINDFRLHRSLVPVYDLTIDGFTPAIITIQPGRDYFVEVVNVDNGIRKIFSSPKPFIPFSSNSSTAKDRSFLISTDYPARQKHYDVWFEYEVTPNFQNVTIKKIGSELSVGSTLKVVISYLDYRKDFS